MPQQPETLFHRRQKLLNLASDSVKYPKVKFTPDRTDLLLHCPKCSRYLGLAHYTYRLLSPFIRDPRNLYRKHYKAESRRICLTCWTYSNKAKKKKLKYSSLALLEIPPNLNLNNKLILTKLAPNTPYHYWGLRYLSNGQIQPLLISIDTQYKVTSFEIWEVEPILLNQGLILPARKDLTKFKAEIANNKILQIYFDNYTMSSHDRLIHIKHILKKANIRVLAYKELTDPFVEVGLDVLINNKLKDIKDQYFKIPYRLDLEWKKYLTISSINNCNYKKTFLGTYISYYDYVLDTPSKSTLGLSLKEAKEEARNRWKAARFR